MIGTIIRLILLGSIFPFACMGQNIWRSHDPIFWDGPNLVRITKIPINDNLGQVIGPEEKVISSGIRPTLASDERIVNGDYHNGQFFCYSKSKLKKEESGQPYFEATIRRLDLGGWATVATGKFRGAGPTLILGLENGEFLAMAVGSHALELDNKSYLFAILTAVNGALEIKEGIDAGLEKPFFDGLGKTAYGALMLPLMSKDYTRTDKFIVISTTYGYQWIFSATNGNFKRLVKLYPGVKEEHFSTKQPYPLLPGILGFATLLDGNVLISARPEEAVLNGLKSLSNHTASDELTRQDQMDSIYGNFFELEWWNLDPEKGSFVRVAPPNDSLTNLMNEKAVNDFNWTLLQNGEVRFFNMKEKFTIKQKPLVSDPKPENPKI